MTVPSSPSAPPRPRTVALGTLFLGAMATGGWMLERGTIASRVTPVNGARLFEHVREHVGTLYIDTIPDPQLYHMAVDGMVAELGDPYSAFLSPDRSSRFEKRLDAAGDPGVQVGVLDGAVAVIGLLPGGAGDRAGLLRGDRITEIDGSPVYEWTPDEIQHALRGAPGSTVRVAVQHIRTGKSATVTLLRAPLPQREVGAVTLLPNGIGYVVLQRFDDSTVVALARAVDSLRQRGARALILDLRTARGGDIGQGVQVAGLFLDRNLQVVRTRGRLPGAAHAYVNDRAPRWPTLPLAVLVTGTTTRAAEVVAGALQDHDRAAVLGYPTAGEGSVQESDPLDSAGALVLTTVRWYTPAGRSIALLPAPDDADTADTGNTPMDTATRRPKYRTDAGRTVLGGGGIVPDVLVGDTVPPAESLAVHPSGPTPPARPELQRRVDAALLAAQRLLSGARSQRDVLDRADKMAIAKKPAG